MVVFKWSKSWTYSFKNFQIPDAQPAFFMKSLCSWSCTFFIFNFLTLMRSSYIFTYFVNWSHEDWGPTCQWKITNCRHFNLPIVQLYRSKGDWNTCLITHTNSKKSTKLNCKLKEFFKDSLGVRYFQFTYMQFNIVTA